MAIRLQRCLRGAVPLVAVCVMLGLTSFVPHSLCDDRLRTTDEENVVLAVKAYHGALASSDSAAAVALLSDDVMVLEAGHVETAEEYISHHLSADIEFASAVKSEHEALQVVVEGNVAWVVSSAVSEGTFRGREVSSIGAELIVLVKREDDWEIRAIHWSSRSK